MLSRMGLGLGGLTRGQGVGGYVFVNAEAAALVARFTTPPTNARKALIDACVGSIKTAGVWAKLDALYLTAAHDAQAARRNWIADLYNLTAVSSPTFTADQGYSGDGSGAHLSTGYNPTSVAGKYALNSAIAGVWSRTQALDTAAMLGSDDVGGLLFVRPRTTGDFLAGRINRASTGQVASADGRGSFLVNRTASGTWDAYINGAFAVAATGATATAVPNGNITLLRISTVYSASQVASAFVGEQLSGGEITALHNALNTYLVAVGAA